MKIVLWTFFVVVSIIGAIGLLISWLSRLLKFQEPITRKNSVPVLKHDDEEGDENEKPK